MEVTALPETVAFEEAIEVVWSRGEIGWARKRCRWKL